MKSISSPEISIESQPISKSQIRSLIGVLILFVVIYGGSMFSPPLLDDADATHAEAAREMYATGDWATLHVNGIRYLEKAPFLYWLTAASYHVFGVNEFATRLPSALAILGLALLAWRWGRRAFGDRAGTYAAVFMLTAAGMYLFTRILIPEAILSLLISLSLYFFLTALEDRKAWRWYAGYACVALGVLTKGLVAMVFVGAAAFLYLVFSGDWRRWREFRLGTGLLLLIAIAAPWHILAGIRNKHFFWFYFINEHVLRFLGKRYPKDYAKLPATLYWSLHLVWLFPWSAYLPILARDAKRDLRGQDFAQRTRLLCWVLAGLILTFFAISTNQEYYTFPAYLPLMLLIAAAVASEEESHPERKWLATTTAAATVVASAAGFALVAGLWASRHIPFVPDIGTVLSHNMASDQLSMSHALDLTGSSLAALRLPAILAAVALLIFPLLALILRMKRRHYVATWAIATGMALFLVAAHLALVRFGPYMSSRSLAVAIHERAKPEDRVMIYGDQAFGSSLLFYLQKPIELVNGRTTSMWFGSSFPDAPKIFLSSEDMRKAWASNQRVFVFVPEHLVKKSEADIPSDKYKIAESSGKVVYSNRP